MRVDCVFSNAAGQVVLQVEMWPAAEQRTAEVSCLVFATGGVMPYKFLKKCIPIKKKLKSSNQLEAQTEKEDIFSYHTVGNLNRAAPAPTKPSRDVQCLKSLSSLRDSKPF